MTVLCHVLSLHGCIVCRFVRRWFRGRTTCARCDIEFHPYPRSALAEKRDSTTSKTPVKLNSAAQVAGPKDLRKPESRPEEKVMNVNRLCVFLALVHTYVHLLVLLLNLVL